MSTDQPPPEQPPEGDPFRKRPEGPPPPSNGTPPGGTPPGGPYGGGPGGSGYPPPPPPSDGDPFGSGPGAGGGYGMPDPLAGMPPLADTGKRFVARVIDLLIVAVPLWIIWFVTSMIWTAGYDPDEEVSDAAATWFGGAFLLWLLIGFVAFIGYDWFFVKKNGQTPGKKAMRMRVAMLDDGSVPPSNAALGRAASYWLPTLCCGVFWWLGVGISILVDKPYQQGLHDKAARTVVVTA
ncbi:RDD family protein [Streptomyces sp. NPDC127106]|uniref:RDD family protein n=1 Tax=Streptomyces sp. NPDC127106 TaxID=3345360 RepID=UPI00362BDC88